MYDKYPIDRPIDMKLNVRPVYNALIHMVAFEGPCRFGDKDELTKEFDTMSAQEGFKRFCARIEKIGDGNPDINMMAPILTTGSDEFSYTEETFEKLAEEVGDVDVFFIQAASPSSSRLILEMLNRFNKPIILFNASGTITEGNISSLHFKGYNDVFGVIDWVQAEEFMRAMKVKKALSRTRVLELYRHESKHYLTDDCDTANTFGVSVTGVNIHEMFDMLDTREDGKGNYTLPLRTVCNLTEEDNKEAERIADELIAGAEEVWIERDKLIKSIRFNILTRKLMNKWNCNAFTGQCKECCATTRINEAQVTYCIGHSLNNEDRVVSACEGDLNALKALTVMACISRKAPYQSNTSPLVLDEEGKIMASMWFTPSEEAAKYPNQCYCNWHATPNRKMKFGFDSEEKESLAIGPFTASARFGGTFRRDFKRDKGEVVTLMRFNPEGTKMLITRSHVLDGIGYDRFGCPEGFYYRVNNRDEFFQDQIEFGSHMVMVFGDYVKELKTFAKIMHLGTVIYTDNEK